MKRTLTRPSLMVVTATWLVAALSGQVTASEPAEISDQGQPAKLIANPLPEGAIARFGEARFRAGGQLFEIHLSSDGKVLLTRNVSGLVRLWDVRTGRLLSQVTDGSPHWVSGKELPLAVSSSGNLCAMPQVRGIVLIDIEAGIPLKWQPERSVDKTIMAITFSPDSKAMVLAFHDEVLAYSLENGKQLHRLKTPFQPDRLHWEDGGKRLVARNNDSSQREWNWPSGEVHQSRNDTAVVDASFLRCVSSGGQVQLRRGRDIVTQLATAYKVQTCRLSADESTVAASGRGGMVTVWRLVSQSVNEFKARKVELPQQKIDLDFLSLSEDGSILATAGKHGGNRVRLWRLIQDDTSGNFVATEILPSNKGHTAGVRYLQFTGDGERLLSCGIDNTARLWHVNTQRQLITIDDAYKASIARDGQLLAAFPLNKGPMIQIFDVGMAEVAVLKDTIDGASNVAVAPQGDRVAYFRRKHPQLLLVRDVARGEIVNEFPAISAYTLLWSNNGNLIAEGTTGRNVNVWDTTTNKLRLATEQASRHTMCFTPDSKYLVSASGKFGNRTKKAIQVWDLSTGQLAKAFGDQLTLKSCDVMPDNRRLIGGCLDGTIRVWDIKTGDLLQERLGHHSYVTSLAISPDGKRFASGCIDSELLLWDATKLAKLKSLPLKE